MKYETGRFSSTETGKRYGYAESVSLKHAISSLLIMSAFLAAGCGSSIHDAQNFSPNEAPVIENVSSSTTSGSVAAGIKKGMLFTITVTAHDPDRQKLSYDFISDYGTFGPVTLTATGCTVPFLTNGFVESGKPVSVKMSAKDTEGASAATSYNVGNGKRGPLVEVIFTKPRFIKSVNNTGIEIRSNCEGIYQIYLDNGIPSDGSGAVLRPGQDYFRYKKNPDGTFKTASAVIAGATNTDDADIKLSSVEQANRVWVVFSDGINEPVAALAETVVDDTAPGIVSIDPVNNSTGAGVNYPVRVTFNEEIDPASISNGSISVSDNNSFFPISDADGTCTSNGNIVAFTPEGYEYYSNYEVEVNSGIKDIAGNEYAGGATSVFTTVDLGTTPVPQFNLTSQTFNTAQNVSFVNIPSDVKIFYTSAVSANPSTPTTVAGSTLYTGTPINVDRNTNIKAIAIRKGYRQSAVQDLSVKIRTPKPSLSVAGTPYPSMLRVFSSDIVFTPNLNGNTLPSGESLTYYYNFVANNGIGNEILVTDPTTGSTQLTTYTFQLNPYRIKLKLIAKATNMEPSAVYESPEYRKRLLTLTAEEKLVPESGYPINNNRTGGPNWKKIVSSSTGQYLGAIETSSAGTDKGFIWISKDYGTTWEKVPNVYDNTAVSGAMNWSGIAVSGTGSSNYWAACANGGRIYTSQDGLQWNYKSSDQSWSDVCISNTGTTMFAATNPGLLYGSYNSGSSWTSIVSSTINWVSVAMDKDNHNAIALYPTGTNTFYISNGGAWNSTSQMAHWNIIWQKGVISADGKVYIAMAANGALHYNNYNTTGSEGWKYYQAVTGSNAGGVTINETGNAVYWTKDSGAIYKSTNFLTSPTNPSGSALTNSPTLPLAFGVFWKDICCDYSGSHVAAITQNGDIWTSNDGGTNWIHQGLRTWTGVACSSDGKIIAACDGGASGHGGNIYISNNGGTSWSEVKKDSGGNSMQKEWVSIAISKMSGAEGQCIYAVERNGTIWRSMNYGVDWRYIEGGNTGEWSHITTSQDGKYVYAGCFDHADSDLIWKSADYGETFQLVDMGFGGEDSVTDIQCSASGEYVVFSHLDEMSGTSNVFYSSNFGTTFSSFSNIWNDETRISLSSDGSILFIGCNDGTMYSYTIEGSALSYNGSLTLSFTKVFGLAMSNDGNLISAATDAGIMTTVNGGINWTAQTGIGSSGWNCVTSTSDGLTIFAGGTKQKNISVLK